MHNLGCNQSKLHLQGCENYSHNMPNRHITPQSNASKAVPSSSSPKNEGPTQTMHDLGDLKSFGKRWLEFELFFRA